MAFSRRLLYFNFCCLLEWAHLSAFNLDTQNVIRKNGEPGSLFGFSLAMHRQLNPSDKRMLLVGAPRAKALSRQKANITGGLYSCEITIQSNDCDRVLIDNEVNLKVENKENQWMGVTVQSQGPGGKVLTCAHRYQRRYFVNTPQETRDVTGRCYMLSDDLSINPDTDEDGGLWKFCEGRASGHERFGYCQQGLSATFTKDYHYAVFGAPGAYSWRGIVRAEQRNSSLLELGYFDDGPYEVGDENLLDPDLVPVPTDSYLGFSVDSGDSITKKGELTIVSGAPRANHSGVVVLLRKDSDMSLRLSPEFILEGPGLASSFGYDVAVVDLNSDGWQDIAVGAPQFFLKDGDVGGAVFVYINQEGQWDMITPIPLYGPKESMFGLAVENIGDINQDSYEDIAVGAPYDNAGAGRVYIYHGSADGINTEAAQVLEGHDHNIKYFGYSLAGNMDLDSNSYPDLAVGSLSDAVFIYRARPVINIQRVVKITPKEIDLTKKTCGNSICLTVDACFTYTSSDASYSPRLTIAYKIKVDSEQRKKGLPSRVKFLRNTKTDQDVQSSGTLELRGQNKKGCLTAELKLQDNVKDTLRGIPIEVFVSIQSSKRSKRRSSLPQLLPVLNSHQQSKAITEISFLKEGCGDDSVCQSNLELRHKYFYREPSKDEFTPMPVENGIAVLSLSDQRDIALEITVTNYNGDDAHEARLVATFPNAVHYSALRSQDTKDKKVRCVANQDGSRADCELGKLFKRDSEITFFIILSTAGISLNITEIEIDLQLETASEQENLHAVKARAKVIIELLLSVSGVARPSQVYFGGEVKGESSMRSEDDIGSLIEHQFRIINLGKPLRSFGTASLNIQWPKENALGKWIMYLVKINTDGLKDIPCSPEREINPLKHIEQSSSRKIRQVEDRKASDSGKFSLFTGKRKYKTLSCNGEARCVEIRCPLQGLDSNAVIVLRSRLWNATFIEDYSALNYINIVVKASLSLDASLQNIVHKNAETQVRFTVFPERTVSHTARVLWWIILVGILAGFVMLALLVFLLWKCGFFKTAKDQDGGAHDQAEISGHSSEREALN